MEHNLKVIKDKYCTTGEPFVAVRVVAAHFGISVWTVYRMAEAGKIPSRMFCGKRRFKISELEDHFNAE